MIERLRRLFRSITAPDNAEESFDPSRPHRPNANPPKRDWFARVRDRSVSASASRETRSLEREDDRAPVLTRDAQRQADELIKKTIGG